MIGKIKGMSERANKHLKDITMEENAKPKEGEETKEEDAEKPEEKAEEKPAKTEEKPAETSEETPEEKPAE